MHIDPNTAGVNVLGGGESASGSSNSYMRNKVNPNGTFRKFMEDFAISFSLAGLAGQITQPTGENHCAGSF